MRHAFWLSRLLRVVEDVFDAVGMHSEFLRISNSCVLQARSDVTALQLASLVERHRFLRSVCMFHTISEEEVRPAASHDSAVCLGRIWCTEILLVAPPMRPCAWEALG